MADQLTKILCLGLDAADHGLIRQWAEDGHLPTLHGLLDNGLIANTMAPPGFYVGATWPSFMTGRAPGGHGFQSFKRFHSGTYEFSQVRPDEAIQGTPFWVRLSEAGKRVAIFDVPLSHVTTNVNGIQIVEWGFHDASYGFQTWPENLKEDILKKFGRNPHAWRCNQSNRTPKQFAAFRDTMVASVRKKAELTKSYLAQGGWDLFVQVFTESHCTGHQCWHLHDTKHPNFDPAIVAAAGNPLLDVYKAMDRAVGELIDMVGEETAVFVVCTHGMMHKRGLDFLVPDILVNLGYAEPIPAGSSVDATGPERVESAMMGVWRALPSSVKQRLDRARGLVRGHFDLQKMPVRSPLDLRESLCFRVDNGGAISGIRVNLKGREPQGKVAPGRDYRNLCDRLTEDLMSIVYADTGEPAVRGVHHTDDLTEGPERDALPDLIVEWTDRPLGSATASTSRDGRVAVRSERMGTVEGTNGYCRTGDHRPEGLMMVRGRGVQPRLLNRTVSVSEIAPTLCALFGVQLPDANSLPAGEILALLEQTPEAVPA